MKKVAVFIVYINILLTSSAWAAKCEDHAIVIAADDNVTINKTQGDVIIDRKKVSAGTILKCGGYCEKQKGDRCGTSWNKGHYCENIIGKIHVICHGQREGLHQENDWLSGEKTTYSCWLERTPGMFGGWGYFGHTDSSTQIDTTPESNICGSWSAPKCEVYKNYNDCGIKW